MSKPVDLLALWNVGVAAVSGDTAVASALKAHAIDRPDRIIAVGKAAAAMASAATQKWPDVPCLIVTKYGHTEHAPAHAVLLQAAHPVPDEASIAAGTALIETVASCGANDHLLMLVSGGASALAEAPEGGLTLTDLQQKTKSLLGSGTPIEDMNAHRTALSRIKGGKLLSHFKGRAVTTFAISDVEGDSLLTIGSGLGAALPQPAFAFTPHIVASNAIARAAIAAASPIPIRTNAETLYDYVDKLGPDLAASLKSAQAGLHIFGGEPVVNLPDNPGMGGRNMALALTLAREIKGRPNLRILVAGTDGTDGPTDAAGALVDGTTWTPSGADALTRADAYPWLKDRGALIKTGPTGTNVMDLILAQKT